MDELPQVLNPKSGFVQNCNSSPFTVTDEGNASLGDFPTYLAEDKHDDKRRAKISRQLLRSMHDITLDDFERCGLRHHALLGADTNCRATAGHSRN